jgi:hypothetical protein
VLFVSQLARANEQVVREIDGRLHLPYRVPIGPYCQVWAPVSDPPFRLCAPARGFERQATFT